ncbi:MAG: hypothetical protein LBU34_10710 [Planctomycetaceae bacterium]|nr:hypothetical protein [Planctomycetaceae bacterium]
MYISSLRDFRSKRCILTFRGIITLLRVIHNTNNYKMRSSHNQGSLPSRASG